MLMLQLFLPELHLAPGLRPLQVPQVQPTGVDAQRRLNAHRNEVHKQRPAGCSGRTAVQCDGLTRAKSLGGASALPKFASGAAQGLHGLQAKQIMLHLGRKNEVANTSRVGADDTVHT